MALERVVSVCNGIIVPAFKVTLPSMSSSSSPSPLPDTGTYGVKDIRKIDIAKSTAVGLVNQELRIFVNIIDKI
ncbi:MAG: hypothetical protein J6T70_18990 [Bacteroidales bacterium]|nr:hypothetical protein [Bacteroidales bacterium]